MRLIDADAAFELLRSLGSRDYRREKGTIMDAMKIISHPEYTPTVDAVEVVHGHWCWEGEFKACSQCGSYVEWNETLGASFWKFCPYCGAKMDGDGDG